ncbi:hypothetical protein [Prosthecomicrobium pneumaticum]|uniref:PepSY domain-containing protein n=1 Tax=Prosthecomicrobium pneumaticum TaxID=81895 RepID=A0A7W9FKD7_9HYPH|nr:hypothetical protein [Prosthecomicrobium pneumaticum]MBB5752546.1 hypothetical protein [Prosthecomicrobium pneumaticum]
MLKSLLVATTLIVAGTSVLPASAAPASIGAGIAAPVAAAAPAGDLRAELVQYHGGWLSPREVRRRLRWQGYEEIRILDRRGRTYVVRAEGRRGRDFILVVSARTGEVLSRRPAGW